ANTVTLDPDQDSELVEIFLEEGFDIMDSAGASLQDWMSQPDNSLALESLQRDLHTLKGGARMAEISPVGDLAHELEFLYEGLAGGQLRGSEGLVGLLQSCHDSLSDMLEAVREQRPVPDGLQLIAAIKHFRSNPDELVSVPSAIKLTPQAPQTQQVVPAGESDDILDIFLEEADDLLENMSEAIARWDGGRDISASIDDVMRILHTLKGGARLAGQAALGNLAHDLEQHLSDAQQQGEPWPESLLIDAQSGFDGLQAEVEQLRSQLDQADQVNNPPSEPVAPSSPAQDAVDLPIVAVSKLKTEPAPASVLPFVRRSQQAALEETSRRAPQEFVKVPADLLEQLVNLAGETSIFRGRVEQQVSDFSFTLSEMDATIDRVRDQLRRLDTETQAQIISRYQVDAERSGYEDFDPLEMDRYSQLQQLSRALFESASDLLDLKETLAQRTRDAETLLLQQARVNTELQEGLMRTRMVPFDRLVPRLRRIVRQVSGELGKQVEFIVGNADGEMDRTVLERIVAPLEHMLRNAVDHGVETVEKRRAAGKSKQGTIRLNLAREGGDIVISLSDDGAGIQLPAVKRKAVERGLMDEDADLSDYEILQFILEPGFTTAERVTQISGRGVGMDVVHSEVKQLGGSMSIESTLGVGSTFLIRLPFTVSVNRALMVLSGEDLYAVPLNTIEGIVRVSPYELEAYYAPDAPRFEYAGQAYQLRYIGDLLNNGQQPKLVGQSLPLPVILVRSNEHAVAIQVDSLAGSREIVVKSLGAQFAGVHGISGATILGDGRVVVILDLLATIRALHAHQLSNSPRRVSQVLSAEEIESERPTLVMVVDDSITVRKVTSRLLERNGMNVFTAKDGVDAISLLQERKPDILLLDIEMPRMDGFEVATLVRHDPRLQDLPIIMITSRTGDKHRERALGLGVNEYLGKPYQESVLLEHIQRLAGDRSQTGRGAIDNVTDMLT
ncbi:MAG: response regulator, partial [Pseudomonas marincola]|uniref:hybrid sensor histidine kinase/response regulator n=2 Tax=Pseudomonas TaxID=286 RepID=UPI00300322D9